MIIGLTGKAGSGKTTVADYLIKEHNFIKVNFKDGLVIEMKELLPDTLEQLSRYHHLTIDELFKVKPEIMRALMQNYGTDVRRKDSPDYWVNIWQRTVAEYINQGKNIVVDDCRFLNEADAVLMQSGKIVRLIVDGEESLGMSHVSETEMDSIESDATVVVDRGDLETLYSSIELVINTQDEKN